jgi:alanyl-tRNA synthetase
MACLSTKQIKALARPEFAADPERFYPTATLTRLGFSRAQCPTCHNFFWRHSDKRLTCGDSQCEGRYTFIKPQRLDKNTNQPLPPLTYAEAWQGFKRSFESARIPSTAIKRYPVGGTCACALASACPISPFHPASYVIGYSSSPGYLKVGE